jgi:hypothetical protein
MRSSKATLSYLIASSLQFKTSRPLKREKQLNL